MALSFAKTHSAAISVREERRSNIVKRRRVTQERGSLGTRSGFGEGQGTPVWGQWKSPMVRHGYRHECNLWAAGKGVIPGHRVTVSVAGLAFGQKAAEGEFPRPLQGSVGETGARAIQAILQSAIRPALGIIASAIGIRILLIDASGAFVVLLDALNKIWYSHQHGSRADGRTAHLRYI